MLAGHLKRVGVFTGPLTKNTSHSRLDVSKKFLLGQAQFKDVPESKVYLDFGSALHERALVNSYVRVVSAEQERHLKQMLANYKLHPIVKRLLVRAVFEIKEYAKLNGVLVAYILDIHQRHVKTGSDIKTTNATSLEDFIRKAIEFGYPRQGVTYKKCAGLKNFFFIGIMKTPPYTVYIFNLADYPEEELYAEYELDFLLHIYKYYGNPVIT